jgi:gamma-glutamylcyclotransferase (GGCT)/AIG2-like uncharacterized protein YtfP
MLSPPAASGTHLFRLFVYGTLKRGHGNHARYCRGVLTIEPASTIGRLYSLPQGYPMLLVPQSHHLAVGTADYLQDAARQQQLTARWQTESLPALPERDWDLIRGEVLTFDDPLARLPRLDALEAFHPGGRSLYHRVLVPVNAADAQPIWTYVAPGGQLPTGARRIGSSWP